MAAIHVDVLMDTMVTGSNVQIRDPRTARSFWPWYGVIPCSDFDECANPAYNTCDQNERCRNTIGSFYCDCANGYQQSPGSGRVDCIDLDECAPDGNDQCHKNARCHNTDGSYECHCNAGYDGNGFSCSDIDECKQDQGQGFTVHQVRGSAGPNRFKIFKNLLVLV